MGKMIAAGHICLDIMPVFPPGVRWKSIGDLLQPGRLVRTEKASVHTGGSVANTGLALKILGNDVTLLGKVGNDAFGGMIRELLAGYGAGGLITDENSSTSYSVVLAVPGLDRVFLHHPGANDTFASSDIPDAALEGASLFHFGYPTLMKRMAADGGAELIRLFRRVRSKGIVTSLDLAAVDPNSDAGKADWRAILSGVLPYTDFFVPSFEELCWILDRPGFDALAAEGGNMTEHAGVPDLAERLARECLEMGCGAALVKCGLSGMVWAAGKRERLAAAAERLGMDPDAWADRSGRQRCFTAEKVLSEAGAGDVSIAAWLTAVTRGETPEDCARLAAAEGAASVAVYDALSGVKPLDELKKRIDGGWKERTG